MHTPSIALECKKLCLFRCLSAVALSMLMQFLLLTIFLLCVNFHILRPIEWMAGTLGVMFSFYTWLSIIPLLSAVLLYGILLGKSNLAMTHYYTSRCRWLLGTICQKVVFLLIHLLVGFLTAWLYARFLHVDYRHLTFDCYGMTCLNDRYSFLIGCGIAASAYHFVRNYFRHEPEVLFPVVQENKLVQIRSLILTTLRRTLLQMFAPTIVYALVYWCVSGALSHRLATMLSLGRDASLNALLAIASDYRLLFYTWLLAAQIVSNMQLMQHFFSVFLAAPHHFTIEQSALLSGTGAPTELTLVQALAMQPVPVVQNLAAREFYTLAVEKDPLRRQEIFALSVPGGHPYNWTQVAQQALALIDAFTDELAASVKKIATLKTAPLFTSLKPSASEGAEKILLRQYNATYGIRRMVQESETEYGQTASSADEKAARACQSRQQQLDNMTRQLEQALHTVYRTIPGLHYTFGEPDGAKAAHLLSHSQTIVWLAQALANICAASIVEDRYGVVQSQLPQIIRALLRLKLELDKLNNVNLNGKRLDRNLLALKQAIKRSLYNICSVFGDYLRELVDDHESYRRLQCFVNYQET